MRTGIIERIDAIPVGDWNRVSGIGQPFLRHEFLVALERHECVGEAFGWLPRHVVAYDADGRLAGAVPLYLKYNSYGEFVFDWAWADACERAGMAYYPKLVAAIPYTPVTGPRLLVRPGADRDAVVRTLIGQALSVARQTGASSLHWLFTDQQDTEQLVQHGFMRRTSCHFHWHNAGYRSFEEYLSHLSSRKRKKIRRERRHVQEAGVRMQLLHGTEVTAEQWQTLHYFYRTTFERKAGVPTLSLEFFRELSRTMGEQLVLVLAHHAGKMVAGAIMLRGDHALYGRHWGCLAKYNSLHFEACYYQGIDYCIENGLDLFEPGAQGEHKISRGFLPAYTWSAHWIADEPFRVAVQRYLAHEHDMMVEYHDELQCRSPFRQPDGSGAP